MTTSAMMFAPPRPALRSWQLLALVIALNLIVLWFSNEYVLTRETYQRLLSDRLEASRVDEYFDFARRLRIWGYVLTPLVVVVRVGFMALALQLALLLLLIEVPIGRLFRLALWAALALLAGTAVREAFLAALDPATLSLARLSVVPASLASVTMDLEDFRAPLYGLLSFVNPFELAWCAIMAAGIADGKKLKPVTAASVVVSVWMTVTILTWGLLSFLNRLRS